MKHSQSSCLLFCYHLCLSRPAFIIIIIIIIIFYLFIYLFNLFFLGMHHMDFLFSQYYR